MSEGLPTRRDFVRSSAGVAGSGWLWLYGPALSALAACAREDARTGEPFRTLSQEEAGTLRALASRIIPSDDTLPGADEAGAVYFADRALAEWFTDLLEPVRAGLMELDATARASSGQPFAALDAAGQDAAIRRIEDTPFFDIARTLTVFGVFSHPKYGGGQGRVGEAILGMTHQPAWAPPFGHYDAEVAAGGKP
jgi:gluconate 2-dehydrogenase gamma chain